jgi:cell division septal protein FtsQ
MKKRSVLNKQSVKKRRGRKTTFAAFGVIRRVLPALLKAFAVVTVIAVISFSFLYFHHRLLTSPYIKLEHVDVKGVEGEIRDELIQMCNLDSELTLLALNLNELKQEMEKHPWVRSVKLGRRFPHTLVVQAEKEIPSALVVTDGTYYMNQWGVVFKKVNEFEEMDFPVITGVSKQESEAQEQLESVAHVIKILASQKRPWSLKDLSEIHVKKYGEISLYFGHLGAEIKTCGDFESKMDGLKKVAKHLSKTGRIHQVTGIDLNFVDGAVVSFRKG